MIVKHLDQILGTESDVDTEGWTSRRLILKDAGMGYSVHDTVIKAGAELDMHYKNHLETVYLTEGAGEMIDLATGQTHPLRVGSIYALNQHDHHLLRPTRARTCAWSACSTRRSPARKCTTNRAPTRWSTEAAPRHHLQAQGDRTMTETAVQRQAAPPPSTAIPRATRPRPASPTAWTRWSTAVRDRPAGRQPARLLRGQRLPQPATSCSAPPNWPTALAELQRLRSD